MIECYFCRMFWNCGEPAVLRVGVDGGHHRYACALHENEAAERALEPILKYNPNISPSYTVIAYEIRPTFYGPQIGRRLWTAKKTQPTIDPHNHLMRMR